MATKNNDIKFKKGAIHFEDDNITFEEFGKDGSRFYDLLKILKELDGVTDITLAIGKDVELEPIKEA
jgi:hypothetical protein